MAILNDVHANIMAQIAALDGRKAELDALRAVVEAEIARPVTLEDVKALVNRIVPA